MFGSAAGFAAEESARQRGSNGPPRTSVQSQDHVEPPPYDNFSLDVDSDQSLADFDESDLEDSSYSSASNFAVVRRQAMNPAPSMLLVSMLEHLCSLYETDQERRNKLFKVICEHLTKMKIVSGVSWLDEFSSVREQYKQAFSNLVSTAVESVRRDAVVYLPLPPTTADRVKLLFQDSPVFSPRSNPVQDAFQTFASRYVNEFLELDSLGKGGFGKVFKVRNKLDGQEYAVKKIFLKESRMDVFFRIVREVKLLASLQHVNVVRYHTAWMEYRNPVLNSNRSSSTNLPALETSYLQDVQNRRSSYTYADSSSIVFQESAASDSEATILERQPVVGTDASGFDVSVESYLHDKHKWKLGLSEDSLSDYEEKDDAPHVVEAQVGISAQEPSSHDKGKCQKDINNKKSFGGDITESLALKGADNKQTKLLDTIPWENPGKEEADKNQKPSELLDTIPWETSGKEKADNRGESSKLLDTIPWETARKEEADNNQKQSKLLDTIPWETSQKEETDNNRRESSELLNTIPWETSNKEETDNNQKPSELLDTIPWETGRKEEADNNQKQSKLLDTIPWKTSGKEEADNNRGESSDLLYTIPWETSRKGKADYTHVKASKLDDTLSLETPERGTDRTAQTSQHVESIEWETSVRRRKIIDNSEKSAELIDTMEWEISSGPKAKTMVRDSDKLLDVTSTLEGETSYKSQLVSKDSVHSSTKSVDVAEEQRRHTQVTASGSGSHNTLKTGILEQNMSFGSASFSRSVRFGHSLPGALVPFTSTPKEPRSQDTLDLPVGGRIQSLSTVKRQHSWTHGIRNGHTETHVCGDRCKLRLQGLADCDLVAETSGVVLYIQMQLCRRSLRDWMASRNSQAALLQDQFDGVSEEDNMRLFHQILLGVNYIHSQGLMHRDLKPPNIFLMGEEEEVCIGDFGLAREDLLESQGSSAPPLTPLDMPDVMVGETTHTSGVGTCTYASPEQLQGNTYNSKSDMYSLGVILFELFHPFGTEMERAKSIQAFRQGRTLPSALLKRWPRQCDFMLRLSSHDPKNRPSAKDVLASDLFHNKDEVISRLRAIVDKQSQEMEELKRLLREKEAMLFQLREDRF